MIFPVCNACIKSNELCDDCKKQSKKNSISLEEIELYRTINKALRNEKHLKDVEIKRIFANEKVVIIVSSKNDVAKLIGKNGIISKKLEKKLDKIIRVVSFDDDPYKFSRDVLHPSSIIGINVVYNGNNEIYRVRLPSTERYLMKITPEFFKTAAMQILGKHVEVEFE
jgi:transcription antitermination factor NusA-like protein